MELKNFTDFVTEAKDAQKSKVNTDYKNKDATHGDKPDVLDTKVKADGNNYEGDKPDVLDTSINEDAQKAKENAEMKNNDASHGEKSQTVKEGDDCDDKEKVLHGEEELKEAELGVEYYEDLHNTVLKLINALNKDPKANSDELQHQRKRKKEIEAKIESFK